MVDDLDALKAWAPAPHGQNSLEERILPVLSFTTWTISRIAHVITD